MSKTQSDILYSILKIYNGELIPAQESINALVRKSRQIPEHEQDKDYTESIESYYQKKP